jgi:hypothetical protein
MDKYAKIKDLPQSPFFKIIDIKYLDRDGRNIAFELDLIAPYQKLFTSQWFSQELIIIHNKPETT